VILHSGDVNVGIGEEKFKDGTHGFLFCIGHGIFVNLVKTF
jgi:hypothetical protein